MIALFKNQISREFLQQIRQPRAIVNGCLFFLMIVVFFPLTMSPDVQLLQKIAPGLVWIAMLLALFLSSERLFQQDYDEGVIEQWLVSGYPISVRVFAKVFIHWVFTLLPMLIFCPFLAVLFSLNTHETLILAASLVLGTPAILFLCALAAAFATGLQQRGTLMALILFPLTLPIMIFGSGTLHSVIEGLPVSGHLALLTAMSMVVSTLMPFAVAGVIRVGLVD
ncbi:MAG: heme exporter protein CcmB [Legionellales bacterium]|nr:heme exporter protein CcmB [Legionellales bacterium]